MSVRVVFLQSAEQDIRELRSYLIRHFGKDLWQASYGKIRESVETLKAFPVCGTLPAELESLHLTQYRQLVSGLNRIIYELRQDILYIHVICDTRRDMGALLTRRLLRAP